MQELEEEEEDMSGKECSMCGDVGFYSELFRCSKCHHRLQHTYCSRWYPNVLSKEKLICDWCSQHQQKAKSKRKEWGQYECSDALGFLLEVAQSVSEDNKECDARSSKLQRCEMNDKPPKKLQLAAATSKGIGRRYKRMSDVLC